MSARVVGVLKSGCEQSMIAEVGGILAEIGADGRFAFRAAIAFVEDQVEHLVHDVEPLDQAGCARGARGARRGRPGRAWRAEAAS